MKAVSLFAGFALGALAFAQDAPKADSPMAKLNFLVGEWTSVEQTTGRDGKPVEFHLKGTNKWAMGGTTMIIDESFSIPGSGDFNNHIIMNYNAADNKYQAWWFSRNSPRPAEFAGVWESDTKFVLSSVTGRPLRITYNLLKDGRYDAALETQREPEKWSVVTTAQYTRTKL